ncbi:UNVERIFIED_CONTAM: hypothetical protein H355_002942 [Colinus virginianus]|nr:hypothetical protein H355_002942 [Colinus virginianus]
MPLRKCPSGNAPQGQRGVTLSALRVKRPQGASEQPSCVYVPCVIPVLAFSLQNDVEIRLVDARCRNPVDRFWSGSGALYVLQQAGRAEGTDPAGEAGDDALHSSQLTASESSGPAALPVHRAK